MRRIAVFAALLVVASALFAQTKVPDAETVIGAPQGTPLSADDLDRHAQQLSAEIRCPVCQGLAIADSPSEMAANMRGQVRALLARGYTDAQVLRYFERSYGQFVLLRPGLHGINALVWVLPIVVLILGIVIVFAKARRLTQPPRVAVASMAQSEEETVDPYVDRVRRMVEGEKR